MVNQIPHKATIDLSRPCRKGFLRVAQLFLAVLFHVPEFTDRRSPSAFSTFNCRLL